MKQTDLFTEFDSRERVGLGYRPTDPSTSREAAEASARSGRLTAQQEACLEALRVADGATSAEVGERIDCGDSSRHVAGRRLPELERAGKVRRGPKRRCRARGTNAVTWWLV